MKSKIERQIHYITYMWNLKSWHKWTYYLQKRKKQTQRYRDWTWGVQGEGGATYGCRMGEGSIGSLEKDTATHSSILAWKIPWSLVGCSPWGCQGWDTTEQLHFRFSLSCIGEGNGNPLQCSCLENPRDGGAWWAAVYGVAQSRTRLKWLSSSRCRKQYYKFFSF